MRKLSSNCVAFVVFMFNFLFAVELVADTLEQVVVGTAAPTALSDGQTIDLTVAYAATDNALVSGLSARLHFDSSALMVGDYSYRLSEGAQPFQIIDDFFDLIASIPTVERINKPPQIVFRLGISWTMIKAIKIPKTGWILLISVAVDAEKNLRE